MTYAVITSKSAWLSQEFGQSYTQRVFDITENELEQAVGRYTRGQRKGSLRGCLHWWLVEKGGWSYYDNNTYGERKEGTVVLPKERGGFHVVGWGGELLLGHRDYATDAILNNRQYLSDAECAQLGDTEATFKPAFGSKYTTDKGGDWWHRINFGRPDPNNHTKGAE